MSGMSRSREAGSEVSMFLFGDFEGEYFDISDEFGDDVEWVNGYFYGGAAKNRVSAGAGLGRVLKHLKERNVLIISAFKSAGDLDLKRGQTAGELNNSRHRRLESVVRAKIFVADWQEEAEVPFGFVKSFGYWISGGRVKRDTKVDNISDLEKNMELEKSLIVIGNKVVGDKGFRDFAVDLCDYFEQESVFVSLLTRQGKYNAYLDADGREQERFSEDYITSPEKIVSDYMEYVRESAGTGGFGFSRVKNKRFRLVKSEVEKAGNAEVKGRVTGSKTAVMFDMGVRAKRRRRGVFREGDDSRVW
jgi:hypothetical protein